MQQLALMLPLKKIGFFYLINVFYLNGFNIYVSIITSESGWYMKTNIGKV